MIKFRHCATFTVLPLLLLFKLGVLPVTAESEPSGSWLDGDFNWNKVGETIPQPPEQEGNNLPNCQHTLRPAVLPEDKLVEAAGWTLTNAAQIYGATTVVTGMANSDGMCRPLDYQVFVFTNGKFSGSLSPIPMDSRTDGSLFKVNLYGEGLMDASFNRYTPEDAMCCASGESRIFFKVDNQTNPPLLVPQFPANTSTPTTPK